MTCCYTKYRYCCYSCWYCGCFQWLCVFYVWCVYVYRLQAVLSNATTILSLILSRKHFIEKSNIVSRIAWYRCIKSFRFFSYGDPRCILCIYTNLRIVPVCVCVCGWSIYIYFSFRKGKNRILSRCRIFFIFIEHCLEVTVALFPFSLTLSLSY